MIDEHKPNNQEPGSETPSSSPIGHGDEAANPNPNSAGTKGHFQPIKDWFSQWRARRKKKWYDAAPHEREMVLLTRVIAFSTAAYTIFSGWTLHEIHSGSADTHLLAESAKIQAEASKAQVEPIMHLAPEKQYLGVYRFDEGHTIWMVVVAQNDGLTLAENVRAAVHLKLSDSAPEKRDYEFSDNEFKAMTLENVPRFTTTTGRTSIRKDLQVAPNIYNGLVNQSGGLYILGKIKYKDWRHDAMPDYQFCKFAMIKDIFAKTTSGNDTRASNYAGPYNDCPVIAPE